MKCLGRKTVIEYRYETEQEAEAHEKVMKGQGWLVEYNRDFFKPEHYRCYFKRQSEGAFL